jgi:hypothetical protein
MALELVSDPSHQKPGWLLDAQANNLDLDQLLV